MYEEQKALHHRVMTILEKYSLQVIEDVIWYNEGVIEILPDSNKAQIREIMIIKISWKINNHQEPNQVENRKIKIFKRLKEKYVFYLRVVAVKLSLNISDY